MSLIGDIGGGVATGGLYNVATGILGKKNTIKEPPEITRARQLLGDFASTGKYGNFTAGAPVDLGYGDFNMTDAEKAGQTSLTNLLSSGIPDQFKLGDQALQDLLATSPGAIDKQFQPFNTITDRNTQDALTAQKRAAAFGGNLYTSKNIKALGDIGAKANETKTAQLAQLTNQALDRRLQAIPLAYQSGMDQQQYQLNNIGASQQYGDLARSLNDQSIKARDAEILRERQELQLPIQTATNLVGSSWTPPVSSSPYADLLNLAGTIGGAYLGGPAGASVGSKAGTLLTPGATPAPMPMVGQSPNLSLFNTSLSGYGRYNGYSY